MKVLHIQKYAIKVNMYSDAVEHMLNIHWFGLGTNN